MRIGLANRFAGADSDRAQGHLFGRPRTAETLFGPETL